MLFESTRVPDRKCSCGLQQRVAALLAYALGGIGGIIFFVIEKENKLVRFSAMQSLILGTGWFAIWLTLLVLGSLGNLLAPALHTAFLALNVLVSLALAGVVALLAVHAWKGEKVRLPRIGALAEQWSKSAE